MTTRYRYLHLDVFTGQKFGGNQLAVFPRAEGLTAELMQTLTKEMNFSESTFVLPRERADTDIRMRIFTPGREMPMAGHPTIGSTFALALEGIIPAGQRRWVFGLNIGPTPVDIDWDGDRPIFAWMTQKTPVFGRTVTDLSAAAQAIGVDASAIRDTCVPVQEVSCGVPFVFFPLSTRAAVDAARANLDAFTEVCRRSGVDDHAMFVFSSEPGPDGATVYSRMFAPGLGVPEDPATGAASGPLGCYLVHHGVVKAADAARIRSCQGVKMGRPSLVHIAIDVEGLDITRVRVGGEAVRVGEGYVEIESMNTLLTDLDLHLFGEGTHHRIYEKLGARVATFDGVSGLHFATWAPNADRVSVVGDFNRWDGRVHAMQPIGSSGVWAIFIPGLGHGEKYKFEIRARDSTIVLKADPYARCFEVPPRSATIAWDPPGYAWRDAAWMRARAANAHLIDRPVSIYEVHLGSWRRGLDNAQLSYRDFAEQLVPYVKAHGFTHIELMPVMEHPFAGSWGYQVTGFFAPTSRFGSPEDFKFLIDACHEAGIGVLLDWVPGHFPKDNYGLIRFDGTALYEHADPRMGEHQDWGTLIFNYGRHEVRNFLLSNALFWLGEYHLDGLRVDAVASMLYLDYSRKEGQWVPNRFGGRENLEAIQFLRQLNTVVHEQYPGAVMVAEESTAWPAVSRPVYTGGLGFTFKWNMGWMHDILRYISKDPVYRKWQHNDITFSMLYAYTENFVLPFSHDEAVHGKGSLVGKMPGDQWQKFANLRALYGLMFGHPGKKLLFMGGEFGQMREWNHDRSLDWHLQDYPLHQGLLQLVTDLNRVYAAERSMHEIDVRPEGFAWIDCSDYESSVVSFVRRSSDPADFTIFVLNFTPVVRSDYRLGVPEAGPYRELINTDAAAYGGSNAGNRGVVQAEDIGTHGYEHSVSLVLPPLACLVLKPVRAAAPSPR